MATSVRVTLVHDPRDEKGDQLTCADVFVVAGLGSDPLSIWTDPETGTFWPRDLVPNDEELKTSCRVWTMTIHDADPKLHIFQQCVPLQNLCFRALYAINQKITTESPFGESPKNPEQEKKKAPNNGVIIAIGHGLGGLFAEMFTSMVLELSLEMLRDYYPGLKTKDWRVIALGSPHLGFRGNILEDLDQITNIIAYFGGSGYGLDIHHTRMFWTGVSSHLRCHIDDDWEEQGQKRPEDEPHGTLKVACFQEGVEEEELAQKMRKTWPNNPDVNGFVLQDMYPLLGGKGLYGLSMSDAPSPILPRKHKNMGQFKDASDPCYLAVRSVLKEMLKAE